MLGILTVALLCIYPRAALAQAPPPSPPFRADLSGSLGWLNGNHSEVDGIGSNDWYNRGLLAAGTFGWYWTDHHKTEVEAAVSNEVRVWTSRPIVVDTARGWTNATLTFQLRRLAMGQHYQFFRNQWVHPYVGAGADFTWERKTEETQPTMLYDTVTGRYREFLPGEVTPPSTELRIRPYAETGFKAYMTPRAFFRADMRVLVHGGIDEVLLRCGFGIDF